MIKRFAVVGSDSDMMQSPTGEYVAYADLEHALRLIEENSLMLREPVASMKSIGRIVRQILGNPREKTSLYERAEALLTLLESDFGQSGRDVRIEAIACELGSAHSALEKP